LSFDGSTSEVGKNKSIITLYIFIAHFTLFPLPLQIPNRHCNFFFSKTVPIRSKLDGNQCYYNGDSDDDDATFVETLFEDKGSLFLRLSHHHLFSQTLFFVGLFCSAKNRRCDAYPRCVFVKKKSSGRCLENKWDKYYLHSS